LGGRPLFWVLGVDPSESFIPFLFQFDIMYGADGAGFREIVKISIVPDYKVTRSIQVNIWDEIFEPRSYLIQVRIPIE
jgi:hypothetical protein